MAVLGSVLYDPATAATASTASLLAMTAFDTANARVTFTAPANGTVLVKVRVTRKGATTAAQVLLGVLDGATVRGRQVPITVARSLTASVLGTAESVFLVTGLTPSTSYSFDAAYGVETVVAATQFGWGGPNNTTANDAYGALAMEVWETTDLLGGVHYDPGTAVSKATSATLAMTAMDTANLRLTFTTAASGAGSTRVAVRLRGCVHGGTATPGIMLGVLDSATVRMRQAPYILSGQSATGAATDMYVVEAFAVISGLSASTSYTWDAAYGVELVVASSAIKYGGPNNTTANDAFGGFSFEVWKA